MICNIGEISCLFKKNGLSGLCMLFFCSGDMYPFCIVNEDQVRGGKKYGQSLIIPNLFVFGLSLDEFSVCFLCVCVNIGVPL